MKKIIIAILACLSLTLGFAFAANALDSNTYNNSDTDKGGATFNGHSR